MEYRVLGNTGLCVSKMGFGGIPIQRIKSEETRPLLEKLMAAGVNYIDTARGYTVSESYLGAALAGIREHFVLATKSMARTKEAMEADIETSLCNLQTDYIDLYQVHNPNLAQLEQVIGPDGALEALLEAKAAGKIGHIGITAHAKEVFEKALELPWVETVMFPYNLVETQGEELVERCHQKGIGFIAMKPLAGGALENVSLALRFLAQKEAVDVIIPGMAEEKEIDQNLAAFADHTPLSEEEGAEIIRIRATLGTRFCRRCNYCAPCSVGISIPSVFLFEGYLSRYGLENWAKDRYQTMAKKASDCIGCGECEKRCPYELPIREMLRSAAEKFGA